MEYEFEINAIQLMLNRMNTFLSFCNQHLIILVPPDLAEPLVTLVRDVIKVENNFDNAYATMLTVKWSNMNLTSNYNSRVNIEVYG